MKNSNWNVKENNELIYYKALGHFSHKQIAHLLGKSVGGVNYCLGRADVKEAVEKERERIAIKNEKERQTAAEFIRYEKLITPDSLEQIIILAAKADKAKTLEYLANIASSIGSDETTFKYVPAVEYLFRSWVNRE